MRRVGAVKCELSVGAYDTEQRIYKLMFLLGQEKSSGCQAEADLIPLAGKWQRLI